VNEAQGFRHLLEAGGAGGVRRGKGIVTPLSVFFTSTFV
jgi:hypothetical protein